MGTYLNPGNSGFTVIRNRKYIPESGLIMLIDEWDAPIRETPEFEKEYLHFYEHYLRAAGQGVPVIRAFTIW